MFEGLGRQSNDDPKPGIALSCWQTGLTISEAAKWQPPRDPTLFSRERSTTWACYPYSYLLTDSQRDVDKVRGKEEARMLWLRRQSAVETKTGLVELTDFYAVDGRLIGVIKLQLPHVSGEMTAAELDVLEKDMDFSIENGLFRPNAEEELEFSATLQLAYLDGASEYVRQ